MSLLRISFFLFIFPHPFLKFPVASMFFPSFNLGTHTHLGTMARFVEDGFICENRPNQFISITAPTIMSYCCSCCDIRVFGFNIWVYPHPQSYNLCDGPVTHAYLILLRLECEIQQNTCITKELDECRAGKR